MARSFMASGLPEKCGLVSQVALSGLWHIQKEQGDVVMPAIGVFTAIDDHARAGDGLFTGAVGFGGQF